MAQVKGMYGDGSSGSYDYMANYEEMERVADLLDEHSANIDSIIEEIYSSKESVLADGWIGSDSKQYMANLDKYLPDVQRLSKLYKDLAMKIRIFVSELRRNSNNIATAVDNTLYG